MILPKPQKFTSRLASIQKISSKVYLERFVLVEPPEIDFLPGQTVMFQVSAGINRSMSIASPPAEKTAITVVHDVSPMGPYSAWTMHAKVGDTMNFVGPLGMFTFDRESSRKAVFIATGTGVAPFRAMLLDLSLRGASLRATRQSHVQSDDKQEIATPAERSRNDIEIALYWGLRHEEDIFWNEEFEDLAVNYPDFRFVLTLSQPASPAGGPSETWQGKRGRVGDYVFVEEKDLASCDFYLCGNKPMVSEMEAALLANNVPKEQIKKELFY